MATAAGTPKIDTAAAIVTESLAPSSINPPGSTLSTSHHGDSPRMGSRPTASTPLKDWPRTGLGKKLATAFIEESIRHSPIRLDLTRIYPESGSAAPMTTTEVTNTDSPRREKKLKQEYPSLMNRQISSPRGKQQPAPQHPPRVERPAYMPATPHSAEQTTPVHSPRKRLKTTQEAFSGLKDKVEEMVSPKARTRHLFEGMEWVVLTNSYQPDPDGGLFRPAPAEPDSPPRSPVAGDKRKATDDPEFRKIKRLRFAEDEFSRGSESPLWVENEKVDSRSEQRQKIDHLSKELQDWEAQRQEIPVTRIKPGKIARPDGSVRSAFRLVVPGKDILKEKEKN